MTLNDAHCHFFSAGFFDALMDELVRTGLRPPGEGGATLPRALAWEKPGSAADLADRWAAELDRHGVARAALIASVPGDEASVAAAVAHRPDRFVGFFFLDPTAPGAHDRARRALAEQGLKTICLFPAAHHYRFDDDVAVRVFEVAAAHRGCVFAHCGVLSIGVRHKLGLPSAFDLRLGDPLALAKTASRFPQVPVIVPHFGAGFFRDALIAADVCPSIHFDTSSSNAWIKFCPGLTLEDVFRRALDVVGPARLLFGTDSSFFPRGWQRVIHETQAAILRKVGLNADEQAQIFGGTFEKLFPGGR
jgi:predicted TIM-barrel fold metal-dependent hydrolase